LDPDIFQRLLSSQHLPDRWVSGLVDREGRFIARVPPLPVGSMASQQYRDNIRDAQEGWFRSTTVEGIENYSAFLKSDLTGWNIGYALPTEFVSGGSMQAGRVMGVGILLSLLAAGVIGYWLSKRISKPMSELTNAADLLGSGRAPTEVHSTINEVAALSSALGNSARAIAQRDQELRRTLDNQNAIHRAAVARTEKPAGSHLPSASACSR
jgi:HAMP domain-containing protein